MPLRLLISNAFGIRPNRVIGGPNWIDSERFDISARAPENTTDNQLSLMLKTLITERFKLVARTEAQDQPAYALVVAAFRWSARPEVDRVRRLRQGGAVRHCRSTGCEQTTRVDALR
jgi:uncharacterized protein (TIGR03435 family)